MTTLPQTDNANSSSSHTGAIVGGVVGGVGGLALLILLGWLLRKRARKHEFDGDFDPDHVVGHSTGATLPRIDLDDEAHGGVPGSGGMSQISPFQGSMGTFPGGSGGSSNGHYGYGESPYGGPMAAAAAAPAAVGYAANAYRGTSPLSSSHYSDGQSYYPQASSENGYVRPGPGAPMGFGAAGHGMMGPYDPAGGQRGLGPQQPYGAPVGASGPWSQGHSPAHSISGQTSTSGGGAASSARAAKEREALGRQGVRGGLGVTNGTESDNRDGVIVHQDGGRALDESSAENNPREIPPTYDSIRS